MKGDKKVRISIVILTYNRCSLLKGLLLHLQNISYEPLEVIVVDNCSKDETQQMVRKDFCHVKYYRTHRNVGAGARNIGLKSAMGEILITLDDDILGITDDDLQNLARAFSGRPNLGAMNFRVTDHVNGSICNWVHHCKVEDYSEMEFITYEITEGAVAFRKGALEKAGYYPENFFLSYEGPDLALRIIDCGYDVIYSSSVSVAHYHSDSGRRPWLNYYYDTRNQFWLAARNFPLSYSIVFLVRGLVSMLAYSVRDGYFSVWLRAVKDGIKGLETAFKARTVLSANTMRILRSIDRNRPSFVYSAKKRLFHKGVRL